MSLNPLRKDDIERSLATPPSEKARQTLDVVRAGIALKRASLRSKFPHLSSEEIDRKLESWLARDGEPND